MGKLYLADWTRRLLTTPRSSRLSTAVRLFAPEIGDMAGSGVLIFRSGHVYVWSCETQVEVLGRHSDMAPADGKIGDCQDVRAYRCSCTSGSLYRAEELDRLRLR